MRTINSGREMKLLTGLYADNSSNELSAYMLKVLKDPNLELPVSGCEYGLWAIVKIQRIPIVPIYCYRSGYV